MVILLNHKNRIKDDHPLMQVYSMQTPGGKAWIGLHNEAIVWLSFGKLDQPVIQKYWNGKIERGSKCPLSLEQLKDAVTGKNALEVMPIGTDFQLKVWERLLRIPYGHTRTYGQLAMELESPKAARAVGNAVGVNPVAWLIPCHRVIPVSGGSGNYRWGIPVKRRLLNWERQKKQPRPKTEELPDSRRKLEEMLIKAKRFEDTAKLAGDIAHDLNNLIAPIRMATEMLKRKIKDDSVDRFVEIIETSTNRARSVIQDILAFSRETGEQNLQVINVNAVLREAEKIARASIPSKITLKFLYQEDAPPIRMDPTQLHRAILNVIVNARDAISNRGKITIRVSTHDLELKVSVGDLYLAPGRYVCISISDTGTGIPPEIRDRIFDPFFTTKGNEEGTGLGLPSVYGSVARAGGFIDLESTVGKGSNFRLYLPEAKGL